MPKIKDIPCRTVESVISFTNDPINNLGFLIPMAMALVSLISGIFGYIMFIVQGGYSKQFSYIKEFGTDGISQAFTSGTSELITSGIISKVIWLLFLVQLVIMLIAYFKAAGKAKKIIMIVDLIVLALIIVLSVVVLLMAAGTIEFSEQQIVMALEPYIGTTVNVKAILITYATLMSCSVITFFVLTVISECRWMIGYSVICLIFNFIVMPSVILLLENVIPLITGVVILAVLVVVLIFIFKMFLGGSSSHASHSNSSSSGKSWFSDDHSKEENTNINGSSDRSEQKKKAGELVREGNRAYVPNLNEFLGFKLYKVHGLIHDYVESDNGIATRELCSVEQLKERKFHIYESKSGREVLDHEIPWRKQS